GPASDRSGDRGQYGRGSRHVHAPSAGAHAHQRHRRVLNNAVLSGLAVLVVLAGYRQAADVAWVAVVAAVVAAAYQFWKLRDLAPHRARPEWHVIRHYLVAGVPYAVGAATLSLYVWIDGILLSMMATSAEVGQYGAATQLIATMGFLPSAVSAAVFPTLARNFLDDRQR